MGNPLLDIQSKVQEDFLFRYELKANDAILCDEKRLKMFEDMVDEYGSQVEYIAGGSTQNTMRVLQWMLNAKSPVCMYMGCIGNDEYGKILATKAKEAGINTAYQVNPDFPTGTCAVCIHGHNRSLCANLSAAEKFTIDHIEKHWSIIENARFYYSAGFFLTVCPEAMLRVSQHAAAQNKLYCMNLSAPFLVQFFKEPMMKIFPYVDILFGNDDEMKPFAKENNLK
uniref:Adenosine kinase n=1 Tax=Romanomermis culicivorax TaxID=13658 RepID=A0A915J3T6_ROMCU